MCVRIKLTLVRDLVTVSFKETVVTVSFLGLLLLANQIHLSQ